VSENESYLWRIYKNAVFLPDDEFDVLCNVLTTEAHGEYTDNFIEIVIRKRKQIVKKKSAL